MKALTDSLKLNQRAIQALNGQWADTVTCIKCKSGYSSNFIIVYFQNELPRSSFQNYLLILMKPWILKHLKKMCFTIR